MIHTTSLLTLPLVLIVWAIDAYLFLALIRLIDRRLPVLPGKFSMALRELSDGVPQVVQDWLASRRRQAGPAVLPSWVPWVIVIVVGLMIRHILVWGIVSIG